MITNPENSTVHLWENEKEKKKNPKTKPLVLSWKWLAEPPKQSWGAPGHTWRITNPCGTHSPLLLRTTLYPLLSPQHSPFHLSCFQFQEENSSKKKASPRSHHRPTHPTPLRPHSTCSPGPRPEGLRSRCPHLSGPRTLLPWKKCINVLHT